MIILALKTTFIVFLVKSVTCNLSTSVHKAVILIVKYTLLSVFFLHHQNMQILYFLIFVCSSSDNTASDTRTLHHPPRLGVGETNEKKDESSQQESPKWAAIRSLRGVLGPNVRAVQLFIIVSVKQILSEFYVHVNNLTIYRPYIHDCYSFVPLGSLDRKSQNLHVAVTSHCYIYLDRPFELEGEQNISFVPVSISCFPCASCLRC